MLRRSASVADCPLHGGAASPVRQRKIDTSTLSYQKSFIVLTCERRSRPAAVSTSETASVTTTASVSVRLRRSPMTISDSTNWKRIWCGLLVAVAVDPAGLVADDMSAVELDDPPAHRVDDRRVVCRHEHRRTGAVDAVEQLHDAD